MNTLESKVVDSDRTSGKTANVRSLLLCSSSKTRGFGYEFVGRIYPDGSFGIGRLRRERDAYEPDPEGRAKTFAASFCRMLGVSEYVRLKLISQWSKGILPELRGANILDLLVLTNCTNSHTRKARGSGGLTKHARRLILNVLNEKQRRYGRRTLTFATFTVPPLQRADIEILHERWADIVRVFLQKLSRMLRRGGLPTGITGCIEIQEKRFRTYGDVYPHLHLVWKGRQSRCQWAYTPAEYRKAWLETLNHYLGAAIDIEGQTGEKIVEIEKSVSAYLAKYISKGSSINPSNVQSYDASFVKSWYICTLKWRQWFAKAVHRVSGAAAEYLVTLVERQSRYLVYGRLFQLEQGEEFDRPITIGWYGKLTQRGRLEIREFESDAN